MINWTKIFFFIQNNSTYKGTTLYNKAHFGIKNTRFGVFIQRMAQSISKYLVALVQWFLFCSQQTRRSTLAATTNSKSSTSEPVHCIVAKEERRADFIIFLIRIFLKRRILNPVQMFFTSNDCSNVEKVVVTM